MPRVSFSVPQHVIVMSVVAEADRNRSSTSFADF